jgi:deoxyribose-phosphate aldolase
VTDAALARRALSLLDLTELGDTCRDEDVETLIAKALSPAGRPAAICIWPRFVAMARRRLKGSGVTIATVINFPQGGDDIAAAFDDAGQAVEDGADEIDLVLPYRAFLGGDEVTARAMIGEARDAAGDGALLKVILETGELKHAAAIRRAAEIAVEEGADFIKTSTGKTPVSATPEAVAIMLDVIKANGGAVGLKPSGGIRTLEDARRYLSQADSAMGMSWATPATFRFGASGLHGALLAALGSGTAAGGSAEY